MEFAPTSRCVAAVSNPSLKPSGDATALQRLFGRNVRRLRRRRGLTQADLAAATGLSTSYIGRIETGRANARATTLAALATALRVEATELLSEMGINPPS